MSAVAADYQIDLESLTVPVTALAFCNNTLISGKGATFNDQGGAEEIERKGIQKPFIWKY